MSPAADTEPAGPIVVECHAGYRGEEAPRRLRFDDGRVEEVQAVRRWLTPHERGFEVRGASGRRYFVFQDVATLRWRVGGSAP